ncbi:MAG: DUF3638 domain-containing protein, partial [Proteobacteria bacterium]|nr:DUF3638 domain-containing protein [Pseudomonadota bacterium]
MTTGNQPNKSTVPLSLSLFAHINNDAHLVGTRTLQGQEFGTTIGYLATFVNDAKAGKTSIDPTLLGSPLAGLNQKLNDLVIVKKDMDELIKKIYFFTENLEKARQDAYSQFTKTLANKIQALPNEGNENGMFIPGGWAGSPGHAMIYEFRKNKEGDLYFLIYNTGDGLKFHKIIPGLDKNRRIPVKCFKIPKDSLNDNDLSQFLTELIKCKIKPLITSTDVKKNRIYDADRLYNQVIPTIAYLNGQEIEPSEVDTRLNEIMTVGQRSGTCTEKVLHELTKLSFTDKKSHMLFLFALKKYSINQFFQENKNNLTELSQEHINLAIENLSRIIEKNYHVFTPEQIEENYQFIKNIKDQLQLVPKEPNKNIQSSAPFHEKNNLNFILTKQQPFSYTTKTSDIYSHYQHNVPTHDLVNDYSNEKLNEFIKKIELLNANGAHLAIVNSIDEFLLNLPLDVKLLQETNNVLKANAFLSQFKTLLSIYGKSCEQIDPGNAFGPKKVIATLSAASLIRWVASNVLKNAAQGNAIQTPLWSISYKELLIYSKNNAGLAQKDPKIDERLNVLLKAEKNINQDIIPKHFDYYTNLINQYPPQVKELLNTIFHQKAAATYKAGELALITKNNLNAEVALLTLLDEKSLQDNTILVDINNVSRLRQDFEIFLGNIFKSVANFDRKPLYDPDPAKKSIYISSGSKDIDYENNIFWQLIISPKITTWSGNIENEAVRNAFAVDTAENVIIGKLAHKPTYLVHYKTDRPKLYHPNNIYSLENGPEQPQQNENKQKTGHSHTSALNKMLWNLRSEPSYQITTSIEYFSDNYSLFDQSDYQTYLEKNIFQPNLLISSIRKNPLLVEKLNQFCDEGAKYWLKEEKISPALYFYALKFDINQYILNSSLKKNHDEATLNLSKLQSQLKEFDLSTLSITDQSILSSLLLKLSFNTKKMDTVWFNQIFDNYLIYKNTLKAQPNVIAQNIQAENEITEQFLALFEQNQQTLIQLIQDKFNLAGKGKLAFPNFIVKNEQNIEMFRLDLVSGEIWRNQQIISVVPSRLASSTLYQTFYGKHVKKAALGLVNFANTPSVAIQIQDDPQKGYFIETPKLEKPYLYCCEKLINNQPYTFELQTLTDKNNYQTSLLGSQKALLNLPRSFFCETTRFWQSANGVALLERQAKSYYIDKNNLIKELNKDYQDTGYTLINLDEEASQNHSFHELFSHFEDSTFMEVLKKQTPTGADYKIYFPRYGLELHAAKMPDHQWQISMAKDPNLILKINQKNPISRLSACLIFEDKNTHEEQAIIPFQEFYVPKEKVKNKSTAQGTDYFPFELDVHHHLKSTKMNQTIQETTVTAAKLPSVSSPWHFVESETNLIIPIDKNTQQFKVQDAATGLYLTYLAMGNFDFDQALIYLKKVISLGGIKGNQQEFVLIEKIMNAMPREPHDADIINPKTIALKAQVLSVLSHFQVKGGTITIHTNDKSETQSEKFQYEMDKNLNEFYENLSDTFYAQLNSYHHIRRKVPSYYKLSMSQEYELLNLAFANKKPTGVLAKRRKDIKNYYLSKESAYLKQRPMTKQNVERKTRIVQKITNPSNIKSEMSELVTEQITIMTPKVFKNNSDTLTMMTLVELMKKSTSTSTLPYFGMSDAQFMENFKSYYQLSITEKEADDKIKLKQFCEKTIVANLDNNNPSSLIGDFAGVLLKVIASPSTFTTLPFPQTQMEMYDFITKLFSKANEVHINLARTRQKNVAIDLPVTSSSLSSAKEMDKITPKGFSYLTLDNKAYLDQANLNHFMSDYQKEQKKLKDHIDDLLTNKYPSGNYEQKAPLLKTLDKEIGNLRNNFNENTMLILAKTYLADKNVRQTLSLQTDQFISKIDLLILELETTMISLANLGPTDKKDQLTFELQELGKQRHKLTMADLSRLYVLADKNEYQLATALSDEKITQLHQQMSDYIQLNILKKTYEDRKAALVQCNKQTDDNTLVELASQLVSENLADFKTQPEIQFFQKESGFLVFPRSITMLKNMLTTNPQGEFISEIHQVTMGKGKSKTIGPLAALKKANGTNLVIIQVKGSLFNTNYADLNSTSSQLFNQEAFPFLFDRSSDCSSQALHTLYDKLYNIVINKNYIVTTQESLQSLELKYLELLWAGPISDSDQKEWEEQIKWLEKSLKLIKYQGDRIIDEIHDELDPKKMLNYTLGSAQSIPDEMLKLGVDLFYFFKEVNIKEIIESQSPTSLFDIVSGKINISNLATWDKIFPQVAEDLVNSSQSPIASLIKKLNLNDALKLELKNYLLNRSDNILETLSSLNETERKQIKFLKEQLSSILPFTLPKKRDVNFGVSKKTLALLPSTLAIPYKANNVPNEQSRFGHHIESMNYTIMLNLQQDFNDALVLEVIDNFIKEATSEMLEDSNLSFDKTFAALKFAEKFPTIDLSRLAKNDTEYENQIISMLKKSESFKRYCLQELILPQIKINPLVLASNTQNAAAMTLTNQGLSGTPHNYLAMHQNIQFDEKGGIGTDGETLDQLEKKKTNVEWTDNNEAKDILQDIMDKHLINPHFRVIVDVGALFRGVANEAMAQNIATYFKDTELQYVLYYDNQDILYALNVKTQAKIKLNTTDEKKINAILKCSPNARFTYYDQARATGTDIVQEQLAHAVVTFSETTRTDSLLQGIKRLRHKNQTATILGPSSLKSFISSKNELNGVFDFVKANQMQQALSTHLRATIDKFKNVARESLLDIVYEQATPAQKSKLLRKFKTYFTKEFHDNSKLDNILTNQPFKDQLDSFEIQILNDWEKLLKDENLLIENKRTKLKETLALVKAQGLHACPQFTLQPKKSKPSEEMPPLGAEIEFQNELGAELENELENETEQELELEQQQLFFESTTTPNLTKGFDYSNGLTSRVDYLQTLNATLKNAFEEAPEFDNRIHVTPLFAKTHLNQKTYFNAYTKPIEVVMMVASKSPPSLNAVVMTKNEAKQIMKSIKNSWNRDILFKNQDVWCVTPRGTLLAGTPSVLSTSYGVLLEQIRYLNGDCKSLAQQKEPLTWLNNDSSHKLEFLAKKILPSFPGKANYYKSLNARIGISNKIYRHILDNPGKDFRNMNWDVEFKGYKDLPPKHKNFISQLAKAIYTFNSTFENQLIRANDNNYLNFLSQYPYEIHFLIAAHKLKYNKSILADKLKQDDGNFLEK